MARTPYPPGHRGCAGDPGCPYRIPEPLAKLGWTVCPWHRELATVHPNSEYRTLALAATGAADEH